MEIHKLLTRQVNKYLTAQQTEDPSFQKFLSVINDSYVSFDRDKELLNHAFEISESEYQKLNDDLIREYELKKVSIEKLKEGVRASAEKNEINFTEGTDDLLKIVDYLTAQVLKRKESEKNLKRSEENYRNMIENATDILYKSDSRGYFSFANPVAVRKTGYSKEELYKMLFFTLIRNDHKFKVVKFYLNQVKNKIASTYLEFPIITKTGEELWIGQSVQFSLTNINADEFELTALAIDITKQKRSELILNETNQKLTLLQGLIDSSSDSIQVATEDGIIFYYNKEAKLRLGIPSGGIDNFKVVDFENNFKVPGSWE